MRVIEESPIRVRLRVEGAHYRASGARHLSYRATPGGLDHLSEDLPRPLV